jgi:hypothetical protein
MKEYFVRQNDGATLAELQTSGSAPAISQSGGVITVNNNTGNPVVLSLTVHIIA